MIMKKLLSIVLIFTLAQKVNGQQLYCDFDGIKVISFGLANGVIDSSFTNPFPDIIDSSAFCAKYIRDTTLYDNIKLYPDTLLDDVTLYASNNAQAPKITMKLYTTAPIG